MASYLPSAVAGYGITTAIPFAESIDLDTNLVTQAALVGHIPADSNPHAIQGSSHDFATWFDKEKVDCERKTVDSIGGQADFDP